VRGTLFTVQKALPLFNDCGSIILNGSIAGVKGFPGAGVYSASKAAVRSFARRWTVDLKARNIRVNVLSPGTIDTPILEGFSRKPWTFSFLSSREARCYVRRRLRPLLCSSRRTTLVSSPESSCLWMAGQRRSELGKGRHRCARETGCAGIERGRVGAR
jgi:NAD(P)-dependent dehydrogenase (short-subunit alcohol dehydrogenase family)